MKDGSKTKKQLIQELAALRQRVAELEASEAKHRQSEQRTRQITSSLREAVWLRDTKTLEVLYVNPAYETIWGRTCQSLYENPTSFVDAILSEDKERVTEAIRNQYHGVFFNQEYRITRPDGSLRWVWGRTFPIENEAGEVYRVVARGQTPFATGGAGILRTTCLRHGPRPSHQLPCCCPAPDSSV